MRALTRWLRLALPTFLVVTACEPGPTQPGFSSTLQVRGRVTAVSSAMREASGRAAVISVADVRKVLVYRDFGFADLVNVGADGRFAVDVARDACGLVFLDAGDRAIGYLTLANGIAALPLMLVDSSLRVVDLDSIVIEDSVARPSDDPTLPGGVAAMTLTEVEAYRLQSALFATIVRNLDMNGDGVIDVLSPRPYLIWLRTVFRGGSPPTSDPGPSAPAPPIEDFSFFFSDFAMAAGTTAGTLQVPSGQRYPTHNIYSVTDSRPGRTSTSMSMYHWVLQNTGWQAFDAGSYRIEYDDRSPVTFDLRDPLNGDQHIVATRMWYEVSADTIRRVHWRWQMRDGRSIDPTRLMRPRSTMLQFGYGFATEGGTAIDYRLDALETSRDVKAPIAGLTSVLLSADDLFGNQLITWYRIGAP